MKLREYHHQHKKQILIVIFFYDKYIEILQRGKISKK